MDFLDDSDMPFIPENVWKENKFSQLEHLCQTCKNFPVCMINRGTVASYESLGIIQAVVTCPFYNQIPKKDDAKDSS